MNLPPIRAHVPMVPRHRLLDRPVRETVPGPRLHPDAEQGAGLIEFFPGPSQVAAPSGVALTARRIYAQACAAIGDWHSGAR
jgi:hypothetical protein